MRLKRSKQQFLDLIHPELKLISDYTDVTSKIVVEDVLGIEYLITARYLLRGQKPGLQCAINPTLAFKLKLKSIQPNLELHGLFLNWETRVLVIDNDNIIYSVIPCQVLAGYKPSIRTAINKDEVFRLKAFKVHGNLYDYSLCNYINNNTSMDIICNKHGIFKQKANSHLVGEGCPICDHENRPGTYASIYKHNPDLEVFIYLLYCYNKDEEFYKVGLSINPDRRINCIPYKIEILAYYKSTVGKLYPVEQAYHEKFKQLNIQYIPNKKFTGYTECFK